MPKITVDIPKHILDDLDKHIGDDKKFVSRSDAIRTACRRLLDLMDEIDKSHGRRQQKNAKK
jgi:Arc/MetJ-type ribon-helix-helix transcriptional regulator